MTLRTNRTPGRSIVHVETPRPDEQIAGMPRALPSDAQGHGPEHAANAARAWGPMQAGTPEAVALAKIGAQARWEKERGLRALEGLGLRGAAPETLAPWLEDATAFAKSEIERLAADVGGGHCGAGPSSMVISASLQLAASKFLFAQGDPASLKLASSLANDSRQNLLAAHHTCALAASSRAPVDPRERWYVEPTK